MIQEGRDPPPSPAAAAAVREGRSKAEAAEHRHRRPTMPTSAVASAGTVRLYCHECGEAFALPAPFHFTLCPCCRGGYLDDSPAPPYPPPQPAPLRLPPSPPWPSLPVPASSATTLPRRPPCVPRSSPASWLTPRCVPSSSSAMTLMRTPISPCTRPSSCSIIPPPPPPPPPPCPWSPPSPSSELPLPLPPCVPWSSPSWRTPRSVSSSSSSSSATILPPPPPPCVISSSTTLPQALPSTSNRPSSSSSNVSPLSTAYSSASSSPLWLPFPPQPPPPSFSPNTWDDLILDLSTAAVAPQPSLTPLSLDSSAWDNFIRSIAEESPRPRRQTAPRSPPRTLPLPRSDSPLHHSGLQAAPRASIAALPTVAVSDPGLFCAVCIDRLPPTASARRLPCGHLYHSDCIVPWLSLRNSCPVCRRSIPMFNSATAETAPSASPSPRQPTPGLRRSLPGTRRIRRICHRLLRYMQISRERQPNSNGDVHV